MTPVAIHPARRARGGAALLILAGALAGGCVDGSKLEAPALELSGWEYYVEQSHATGDAPARPLTAPDALWRPVDELRPAHLGGPIDLWLRVELPELPAGAGAGRIVARSRATDFVAWVDGRRVYEFSGPAAFSYHVIELPAEAAGGRLVAWLPRPRPSSLLAGSWRLTSVDGVPRLVADTVRTPLRRDVDQLLAGIAIAVVGLAALVLAWVRGRRDVLLISFGLAVLLYGLRLLAGTHFAQLVGLPPMTALYAISFITYSIQIPVWLFLYKLLGPGWKSSILWLLRLWTLFAVAGIATDLVLGTPMALGAANNLLVIGGMVVAFASLLTLSRPMERDVAWVLTGLAVFALLALNANLAGLGLLPWSWSAEWPGMLFFIGALGSVAARRHFASESRLVALEAEVATARRIQNSLLPGASPELPGVELAARYVPMSGVAGDLYDFLEPGPRQLGILVADVSGHGVPAALIASMVKVAASAQLPHADDPARVLAGLNRILCENLEREFVTAVYVFVDLDRRRLIAAGGGHPQPLLLRRGEARAREIELAGTLLGRFGDAAYRNVEVELAAGDRLLLYTDGVTEARDATGAGFGEERLRRALERPAAGPGEVADNLLAEVERWSPTGSLGDDLTIVVADFDGLRGGRRER